MLHALCIKSIDVFFIMFFNKQYMCEFSYKIMFYQLSHDRDQLHLICGQPLSARFNHNEVYELEFYEKK